MKKTFLILIAFIFLLVSAVAEGAEWHYIGETVKSGAKFYIDVDSIKRSSKNLVRVWIKQKERQPEKDNVTYALHYKEFDCKEKRARFLASTLYYKDGSTFSSNYKIGDWKFISLDSVFESELNVVCNKKIEER